MSNIQKTAQKLIRAERELHQVKQRLLDLETIKSNFISMVSHELRTPLTAIKGFVVTLLKYDREIDAEKRRLYLNVLNIETDRLTRLITELLDISRLESSHVEPIRQKVSIPPMVRSAFDRAACNSKPIRFISDFPADFPGLLVDPEKMEQVFMNLIENALRYSPAGGTITVQGRVNAREARIQVKDEGEGIPSSDLEKIFEQFYRLDTEINRKNPGTGLGLPICRALVNLHGGRLWAESEGKGSQFIIALPLRQEEGAQTAPDAVVEDGVKSSYHREQEGEQKG